MIICSARVATDHRYTLPSAVPLANRVPSGENAQLRTPEACSKTPSLAPSATRHTHVVRSALPVATMVPSGEKEQLLTQSE
jgi:hypothetical protein